ncbi:hypothetical protein B0T20DRAFT_475621 [Sordaria brevicollis]|uniref:Uncharacterized protein n=1 Tax=Sordaria brevicollis TaxID=83679 RepID=A0AAE0UF41_SORBR|nr:hypothetical protein B0T20DRAFT_475621 [Sordaria brevicollis]
MPNILSTDRPEAAAAPVASDALVQPISPSPSSPDSNATSSSTDTVREAYDLILYMIKSLDWDVRERIEGSSIDPGRKFLIKADLHKDLLEKQRDLGSGNGQDFKRMTVENRENIIRKIEETIARYFERINDEERAALEHILQMGPDEVKDALLGVEEKLDESTIVPPAPVQVMKIMQELHDLGIKFDWSHNVKEATNVTEAKGKGIEEEETKGEDPQGKDTAEKGTKGKKAKGKKGSKSIKNS